MKRIVIYVLLFAATAMLWRFGFLETGEDTPPPQDNTASTPPKRRLDNARAAAKRIEAQAEANVKHIDEQTAPADAP